MHRLADLGQVPTHQRSRGDARLASPWRSAHGDDLARGHSTVLKRSYCKRDTRLPTVQAPQSGAQLPHKQRKQPSGDGDAGVNLHFNSHSLKHMFVCLAAACSAKASSSVFVPS